VALIICGIDEAGYGPLLGPLCVAMSAVRIENWAEGDRAPDVWKLLRKAVARAGTAPRPVPVGAVVIKKKHPRAGVGRILVDDSKKLKLANDGKRHPLTHLERGVLSFLLCRDGVDGPDLPASDSALMRALGVRMPTQEWYHSAECVCPAACSAGEVLIGANVLRSEMAGAGVSCLSVECRVLCEREFNEVVRLAGTKAAATEAALVAHLWVAWEKWAGLFSADGGPALRVVCDRQGGRTQYAGLLARAFTDARVTTVEERPARCRYEVDSGSRRMVVQFMPEAESHHLPVALASMAAKLTRETLMGRFNRYWNARLPELKPTAGYRQDGWRWLTDVAAVLTGAEREAMIRKG